jgi:hypothetical protein
MGDRGQRADKEIERVGILGSQEQIRGDGVRYRAGARQARDSARANAGDVEAYGLVAVAVNDSARRRLHTVDFHPNLHSRSGADGLFTSARCGRNRVKVHSEHSSDTEACKAPTLEVLIAFGALKMVVTGPNPFGLVAASVIVLAPATKNALFEAAF